MKTLSKRGSTLFILFFASYLLSAQCSDVYIYRVNNSVLQSEKPVYIFNDGQQVAVANLGSRFKTSICTPSEYEFVVKTDPNKMSIIKKTIQVEDGKEYFLKVSCTSVGELVTIAQRPNTEGRREVNKSSKFRGPIQTFNVGQSAVVDNTPITGNYQTPSSNQVFQKSHTIHGFKFDVVNVIKAGDMLRMEYKITNMTGNDRRLYASNRECAFYDDKGNFYTPRTICIMTNCREDRKILSSESQRYINGQIYIPNSAYSVIPYGIPVTGSVEFRGLKNQATKFVRGGINIRSEDKSNQNDFVEFKLEYNNIFFPTGIDPNNPNNRQLGLVEIEAQDGQRVPEGAKVNFKFKNKSQQEALLSIKSAIAYDEQGSPSELKGLAFGNTNIDRNRYRRSYTVPPSSDTSFDILFAPLSSSTKKFSRIKVHFEGYELQWDNISLSGQSWSSSNPTPTSASNTSNSISANNTNDSFISKNGNYINYRDFSTGIKNNVRVTGKKIILEQINFNTGSAEILDNSIPQLSEVASLMLSNSYLKMEFSGHTDNVGDDTNNMLLSQQRADAIRYYLIQQGIDPSRIISVGKGENEPLESNQTETGRRKNRRVEIKVLE